MEKVCTNSVPEYTRGEKRFLLFPVKRSLQALYRQKTLLSANVDRYFVIYLFDFFSFAYETNKTCLNKPGLTNSITPASQQRKLLRPRLIVSRKTDGTGHHGKRILPMKPHAPRRTEEGK